MRPRWSVPLVAAWTVAALLALVAPGRDITAVPGWAHEPAHVVGFTVGAWLWLRAFPRHRLVVAVVLLAVAVGSEAFQAAFVEGRGGEVPDVVADVAGLAVAWWLTRPRSPGYERA
jgi:hypothetical protein